MAPIWPACIAMSFSRRCARVVTTVEPAVVAATWVMWLPTTFNVPCWTLSTIWSAILVDDLVADFD